MLIKDFATIDFETYYDKKYSLSKMQTDEYVLDDRFEIIGVGVKAGRDEQVEWFDGRSFKEIEWYLRDAIDWENTAVCCHNAHFDGFIATQRLNLQPKLWLDTLSMARMVYPELRSHSLATLAETLGIGRKGHQVASYIGYHKHDFTLDQITDYAQYCMNDVALTHTLAELLLQFTPDLEQYLIDMTIRMFTEPHFVGDRTKLREYYHAEIMRKQKLLDKAKYDKSILMSNPQLADLLRAHDVAPPEKLSKRTGKMTYAFAKSDKEFTALLEHEDPDVQAIVAARLGVKSTIAETRALRFLETADRGYMPVYLAHWGAKTTGRLSGGNKMNWQNLPARGPAKELRTCIKAPDGYKVVVGDSSNIELRMAMVLAGQNDIVKQIRKYDELGDSAESDVYCDFASKLTGRTITKADKKERLLGKVAMLSLQYGSGFHTFMNMVRIMGGDQVDEREASDIVRFYRNQLNKLPKLWRYCNDTVLPDIHNGTVLTPVDVQGWFLTNKSGYSMPGYPGIVYHNLRKDKENEWIYTQGRNDNIHIYGGKVVENLCQHAARNVVLWQTALVHRKYPVALSVHDEIVCVVPEEDAENCKAYMEHALTTAPKWCRGELPLAGEVAIGDSYGEAK